MNIIRFLPRSDESRASWGGTKAFGITQEEAEGLHFHSFSPHRYLSAQPPRPSGWSWLTTPCRATTQAGAAQGTLVLVSNLPAPPGRRCLFGSSTSRALLRVNSTTERALDIRLSRPVDHPLPSDAARTLSETPCRCSTIEHSRASSMPWCRLRASQRRCASRIVLARRIVAVAYAT